MEPDPEVRVFDVLGCPRCGEDHPARNFFRNENQRNPVRHPAWWSLCPVTGDTLALVTDRDGYTPSGVSEVAAAID